MPFVPKMYEYYYTYDDAGVIKYKLNQFSKEDMFNMLTQNCYHTEEEAKAESSRQQLILDSAREKIDKDLVQRFTKWLLK